MKKLISILLVLMITVAAFTCCHVSAADNDDILVITDAGTVLASLEVGNEFIYRVGVNSGDYLIHSGQGYIRYDSNFVQVVEHGVVDKWGDVDMDKYSFPKSIYNTSLVSNFFGVKNRIKYNFTKPTVGVDVFDSVDKPYFKVRFKAVAPGRVEISHVFEVLSSNTGQGKVRIFDNGKPNTQLDPVPYQQSFAEPAVALIGDADGDYNVTVMDATFIQRVTAGIAADYKLMNADVNGDGDVNLKDALDIRKYKVGMTTDAKVSEWIFESEIENQ